MSEREYHSFSGLDLLASAVILVDDACNIRYLNPAAENLVATSINTLSGRPLKEAISHSHTLQTALDEALANSWAYTGQNIELKRADGELLQVN